MLLVMLLLALELVNLLGLLLHLAVGQHLRQEIRVVHRL